MVEKRYVPRVSGSLWTTVLGSMFVLAGVGMFPCSLLPIARTWTVVEGQPGEKLLVFAGAVLCLGLLAIGCYTLGYFTLIGLRTSLRLTASQLVYVSGRRTTAVTLAAVARVRTGYVSTGTGRNQRGHFVLVVEEASGRRVGISLVGGGDLMARFDTRELLRDLLPRIPSSATVDPKVLSYVETGSVS